MEGLNKNTPKETISENNSNLKKKEKQISIIEIDGIKIEAQKEYFEYPEYIQKESGVIGYDRTIIDDKSLFNIINNICKNKGIDLLNEGAFDFHSLKEKIINQFSTFVLDEDHRLNATPELIEMFGGMKKEVPSIFRKVEEIMRELLKGLLLTFSNGEYPNKCFTHQMGADYNRNRRDEFKQDLVENKFFVHKIYDIDYVKEQTDKKGFDHTLFNATGGLESWNTIKSDLVIYDNTGEEVEAGMIAKLGSPKYFEGIKNGSLFACTPKSGFNVDTGKFFYSHEGGLTDPVPSFGFSMKNNIFFQEYLNKSLDIYTKEIKGIDWKELEGGGINSIVQELVLSDSTVQEIIYKKQGDKEYIKVEKYDDSIIRAVKNVVEKIEEDHGIKLNDYLISSDVVGDIISSMNSRSDREKRLPVFIGKDDIPQLCRGHASFCHFMSSKGFNFIRFKHADHLPNKDKTD